MTTALQISSLSREYIRVRVDAEESGVQVDPTADVVQFAFEAAKITEPTIWTAGAWETDPTGPDPIYYARIDVGVAGSTKVLTDGEYWVWIKVTDSPEIPVRQVGRLVVT